MSHERPFYERAKEADAARRHLDVIEHLTGHRPPTCPWRSMYHPLVSEVLAVLDFDENGNLAVALGSDPPALLIEAISTFTRAMRSTRAEDQRLRLAEARRQREAAR